MNGAGILDGCVGVGLGGAAKLGRTCKSSRGIREEECWCAN